MHFGVKIMQKTGTAEESGFPWNTSVKLKEGAAQLKTQHTNFCEFFC